MTKDQELELKRLWDEGLSIRLCAKQVGISIATIQRNKTKLNLLPRDSPIGVGDNSIIRPKPDFSFPDYKDQKYDGKSS